MPSETALIGFCGSPWTVATYMVAGQGSPRSGRRAAAGLPRPRQVLPSSSTIVVETLDHYLDGQIAGRRRRVQIVRQLGRKSCTEPKFERWVIAPDRRIVSSCKRARHPGRPDHRLSARRGRTAWRLCTRRPASTALGLRHRRCRSGRTQRSAKAACRCRAISIRLRCSPAARRWSRRVEATFSTRFAGRPHIFNLGHGIVPETPIAACRTNWCALRRTGAGVTDCMLTGLPRPRLSLGEGAARHLGHRLDGRPVLPAALLRLSQPRQPARLAARPFKVMERRLLHRRSSTPAMMLVWLLGLMLACARRSAGPRWLHGQARAGRWR